MRTLIWFGLAVAFVRAVTIPMTWQAAASGESSDDTGKDRYFLSLFAIQGEPNLPRFAHSFAVFTRVPLGSGSLENGKAENHSISWLPSNGVVQPLRLFPQTGRNFSFSETLELAKRNESSVTGWGPFEIERTFYDMGLKKKNDLESGKYRFISLIKSYDGGEAVNCIHALLDVDPSTRGMDTGIAYGIDATLLIQKAFANRLTNPATVHSEIVPKLGADVGIVRWEKRLPLENASD